MIGRDQKLIYLRCPTFCLPRSNARRDILWNWSKGSVLRHEFRARRNCPPVLGYRKYKDPRSASPKACGSPRSIIKICAQQVAQGMLKLFDGRIGQCWEATPWQNHHRAELMPKASAIGVEVEGHAPGTFDLPLATIR